METDLPESISGTHQLAAVMFTDVVSFSARMHADEAETMRLVSRDIRRIKEIAEKHKGRVLKIMGDGVLIHFSSATEAVRCGLEFQNAMQAGFGPEKEKSPLQHRVGIHLGDMYVSASEVMGDGVNIASRLQTMAEPGGICISQTVYDIIKNKVALNATSLGAKELKNIAQAVNVYKILIGAVAEPGVLPAGRLAQATRPKPPGIAGRGNPWPDGSKLARWPVLKPVLRWALLGLLLLLFLGGISGGLFWGLNRAGYLRSYGGGATLTEQQARDALIGRTVSLGHVLFVHPSGEIRPGDLLSVTLKSSQALPGGKTFTSDYAFTLRVRGVGRPYEAKIGYDAAGTIGLVSIDGPLDE